MSQENIGKGYQDPEQLKSTVIDEQTEPADTAEDEVLTPEQQARYDRLKWQLGGRTIVLRDATKTKLYGDTKPYEPQA